MNSKINTNRKREYLHKAQNPTIYFRGDTNKTNKKVGNKRGKYQLLP